MIYIGLEFGSFFEIPFDSPCHHILIGVNPLLQMIFTFMQMYFIFMNARVSQFSPQLGVTLYLNFLSETNTVTYYYLLLNTIYYYLLLSNTTT